MIRFMKHFVTDGTTKAKCWYSKGTLIDGRDCVTIYGTHYERDLHKVFPQAENGTDYQTDYFENSNVRIFPGDPLYKDVLARTEANKISQDAHWDAVVARRAARKAALFNYDSGNVKIQPGL